MKKKLAVTSKQHFYQCLETLYNGFYLEYVDGDSYLSIKSRDSYHGGDFAQISVDSIDGLIDSLNKIKELRKDPIKKEL